MEPGDRITGAYHRLWEQAAETTGHPVERIGGMSLVSTGAPVGFLNRAFVQVDPDDPAASLDEAHRFFGDLPFFFEVRRDLYPRAAKEAITRGLPLGLSAPGMVMSPVDVDALRDGCDGLEIKQVSSDEDLTANLAIQAEAFGLPIELIEHVFKKLFAADNTRCFTGWYQDQPVTTSVVVADDGLAGVYSVATLDKARGRGFGEAMTAAAVRSGFEDLGCHDSYLQSSEMGRGIYERMGYRTITTYDGFACGA